MRQSVWTDHLRRSVVALGACGIAFGLAACGSTGESSESAEPSSISESSAGESPAAEQDTEEAAATEEPATEESATEEGDATTFSPCDLETDEAAPDPRLESVVGEWTAVGESFLGDSEGQGSLLCIDGDGDVSYASVDGSWNGALTIGEVADHDVQLQSLDDQTLITEWVFRYDAETDTIDVGEPDTGGVEYARAG